MSTFFRGSIAVPWSALPVLAVDRSRFVKTFPPYCIVVKIAADIGVDGIFLCCEQSVAVCLAVGARGDTEETVFRVYSIETAVSSYSEPSDVIA